MIDTAKELLRLRPRIESALRHADGELDFWDVCGRVAGGQMQFWPAPDSVLLTEVIVYPKIKCLNIVVAAGHLGEIRAMRDAVEDYARSRGCSRLSMLGRKGWARSWIETDGWKVSKNIVMTKELRPRNE